jgi:hypothetical protein
MVTSIIDDILSERVEFAFAHHDGPDRCILVFVDETGENVLEFDEPISNFDLADFVMGFDRCLRAVFLVDKIEAMCN